MQDVNSEILKLKALINNKQSTSVFANKANETSSIVHDGYKFYVNDMTKKFTFTAANTNSPITLDARSKSIDNVEYLDGIKVSDLKDVKQKIFDLDDGKAEFHHRHTTDDVINLDSQLALIPTKADAVHTHTVHTHKQLPPLRGSRCILKQLTRASRTFAGPCRSLRSLRAS